MRADCKPTRRVPSFYICNGDALITASFPCVAQDTDPARGIHALESINQIRILIPEFIMAHSTEASFKWSWPVVTIDFGDTNEE